jgi:dephospho-CoA kinase
MILIGLTGGIGSGKSTVSAMLAARGAVIVDADLVAAEVREPGGAAYEALVERFGSGILLSDGRIDRDALGAIVFKDDEARRDLNAITHPAVGKVMLERVAAHVAEGREIVVLDIPLLAEGGGKDRWPVAGIVVVDVPEEVQIERLVRERGMDGDDVLARIRAQASRSARLGIADFVIDNSGSLADLEHEVDRCWHWIQSLG